MECGSLLPLPPAARIASPSASTEVGKAQAADSAGKQFEVTSLLEDMPSHYLSACFRMKFTVRDPAAIRWLLLRIDYDDGFVAYLNGTEVARRGFAPQATVSFDTPAAPAGHTWGEEI